MNGRRLPQASIWVMTGSPLPLIAACLILINIWAFALMGFDKGRAGRRGARRVRERTLFLAALLGGGLGACLGMWGFRHKTRHWRFAVGMPLILLIEAALGWWAYARFF